MAPGLAGAALAALGAGEAVGHIFGRGLAPWVSCLVAAGFLLRIGAELNAPPLAPAQDGE